LIIALSGGALATCNDGGHDRFARHNELHLLAGEYPATHDWWMKTFGGEVFWPWFTLIGTCITLGVAWVARAIWPE